MIPKATTKEIFLNKDVNDKVKANPKTTMNAKVLCAMKKLLTSYNNDANKIIKAATQEKKCEENLNFLINLAMVADNIKPTDDESKMFWEA